MRIRMLKGYRKVGDGYWVDYVSGGEFEVSQDLVSQMSEDLYEIIDEGDREIGREDGELAVLSEVEPDMILEPEGSEESEDPGSDLDSDLDYEE